MEEVEKMYTCPNCKGVGESKKFKPCRKCKGAKEVDGRTYWETYEEDDNPCPDSENYPCYECGNPTGRGYDDGLCCQCSGE
jgi:hypothetical protein